jgi:hypothetical protein
MVNDFDPKTIRKQLDAMRRKHGADSPIGHRCSNLIGQLDHLKNYEDMSGKQRADIEKAITKSVADLAKLAR